MKYRFLVGFVVAVLLQGCVTTPVERSIAQEYVPSVKSANVFVRFRQSELVAFVPGSRIGSDFGIVGSMIDAYEDKNSNIKMHSILSPLNNAISDIHWGKSLAAGLSSQNIFINPEAIQVLDNTTSDSDLEALINNSTSSPVLIVDGQYYLDPWYRVLTVSANVSLYQPGNIQPVHEFRSVYYSKPVSAGRGMTMTGKFAPRWVNDNAKAFRESHREGVNEVAKLIKTALVDRPSNMPSEQDVMYEYMDWDTQVNHPVEAKLIEDKMKRAVLLDEYGRFLSVPVTETYSTSKEASRSLAPNKARIYLYQKKGTIAPIPEAYSNSEHVGAVYPGHYLVQDVAPGKYAYSLRYEGEMVMGTGVAKSQFDEIEPVIINATAGNTYYIRFDGYRGIMTPDDALKQVKSEGSRSEIENLALSY